MWRGCLILWLVGCSGKAAPPAQGSAAGSAPVTTVPAAPGDAAPPPVDAAPALVDLLRTVPSSVRVSSTVQNLAIKPAHLVDRDLNTAWNSRTGDDDAWIEIATPSATAIRELRLTAGFTGKGPRGEDYFTMNPRLREVELFVIDDARAKLGHDPKSVGKIQLDPEQRGLQTIAVPGANHVRLRVRATVAGSKQAWREIAISELEAWGTPPPSWPALKSPIEPKVEVADYVLPTTSGPCEGIERRQAAFNREHPTHRDFHEPAEPDCEAFVLGGLTGLPGVWSDATAWCDVNDSIFGPTTCTLTFSRGRETAGLSLEAESAKWRLHDVTGTLQDVIPGGDPELVMELEFQNTKYVVVCRSTPSLGCTDKIRLAYDGTYHFDKGDLVVEAGKDPDDAAGRHPLAFSSTP